MNPFFYGMPTKTLILVSTLFLTVMVGTVNQSPAAASQVDVPPEADFERLSVELMNAVERKDRAALEQLVAGDFFLASPGDEGRTERSEWINNAISMNWTDMRFHNVRVTTYGDTAVVTSLLDFKVSGGKVPFTLSSNAQITDLWKYRDGQWKIAARLLGSYSIGDQARLAAGFVAGLACCLLVWGLLRIRRRVAARKRLSAST